MVAIAKLTSVLPTRSVERSIAESSTQRAIASSARRERARMRERWTPVSEKRIVSDPENDAERRKRSTSAISEIATSKSAAREERAYAASGDKRTEDSLASVRDIDVYPARDGRLDGLELRVHASF